MNQCGDPNGLRSIEADGCQQGTKSDPSLVLFNLTSRAQAEHFLETLTLCDDATTRQTLCEQKRDELLHRKTDLKIEFAFYKSAFSRWINYQAFEDGKWSQFTKTANTGAQDRQRTLVEMEKAAKLWGGACVRHCIEGRGSHFAKELALVAKQHPDFMMQALPRLQQLVCRRVQLNRRRFKHLLELTDLKNARRWKTGFTSYVKECDSAKVELPLAPLGSDELPVGFTHDCFGFIVPRDFSVQPEEAGASIGMGSPSRETISPGVLRNSPGAIQYSSLSLEEPDGTWSYPSPLGSRQENDETNSESGSNCERNIHNDHESSDREDGIETSLQISTSNQDLESRRSSPPSIIIGSTQVALEEMTSQENGRGESVMPNEAESMVSAKRGLRRSGRISATAQACPTVRDKTASRPSPNDHRMSQLRTLASRLGRCNAVAETTPPKRKRCNSLPTEIGHENKRPCALAIAAWSGQQEPPHHDTAMHQAYLSQAISELRKLMDKSNQSRGSRTADRLLPILQSCKHPEASAIHIMSGEVAKDFLEVRTPSVPVITQGQQQFQWTTSDQPIVEFFDWLEDHDRLVSVQVPSRRVTECSFEHRTLREIRDRFLSPNAADNPHDDPWNILDCICPMPSTLPGFLTGRNCQLLGRIRDRVLNGDSAERARIGRRGHAEWRDIEFWSLLSEGGHCTAPHTDSRGLSTWITVQQGYFGFIWLSSPTNLQREDWLKNTDHYDITQQWRYWVLKPGETIYFPSGTIHAVFRIQSQQTFAVGGHILQWSGIEEWSKVVTEQAKYGDSTNEYVSDISEWVAAVEHLVNKRLGS